MFYLFPIPKKIVFSKGFLPITSLVQYNIPDSIRNSCKQAGFVLEQAIIDIFPQGDTVLVNQETAKHPFSETALRLSILHTDCHKEGYTLDIDSNGITIACNTGAGLFYSLQTLKQIICQSQIHIPYLTISDQPSLDIRGIMTDIGRDKIPKMSTFYSLIDKLAELRINHLEFYMEGFSFDYKQYAYLFPDETPLTGEELKLLSKYAASKFIDLVPNQNVLGHMEKWLEKPQFNTLAECEDGFLFENLIWRAPMTLDVSDEKSFELAKELLDELIQNSASDYINVNMDEPFELGMGKNKEIADKEGRFDLYFNYVKKVYQYCQSKNKKMLMWGDEILSHPDRVSELSKDIILMDWIYESEASFEEHAKLLMQTGQNYCLCPGTSSWGTFTGRTDNMKRNIADAVDCAVKYKGLGVITTDWGDLGHWQYLSASYPGFAYTGLYTWSGVTEDHALIEWFCNRFIYKDFSGSAFQIAHDLGNYYHMEHAALYNTTLSFAVMSRKYVFNSIEEFDQKMEQMLKLSANIGKLNSIPPKPLEINVDYKGHQDYMNDIKNRITAWQPESEEGRLIKAEMEIAAAMICHGMSLYYTMKELRHDSSKFKEEISNLLEQLNYILKEHYNLWQCRNRIGGFSRSSSHMIHLMKFYRKMQKEIV